MLRVNIHQLHLLPFFLVLSTTSHDFCASPPETDVAGGIMFLGCMSVHMYRSHEHDISRMPWGNFFKFGTHIKWLDFGQGQGYCDLTSVPFALECDISGTPGGNFITSGKKHPLELKDELIRIWWSKVNIHCDLTKHIFGHKSRTHMLIRTKFHKCLIRIKWWGDDILYPKSPYVKTSCFSLEIIHWNHTCEVITSILPENTLNTLDVNCNLTGWRRHTPRGGISTLSVDGVCSNWTISVTTEQTSLANKDHEIWLKASEKSSKLTLSQFSFFKEHCLLVMD